MRTAMILIVLLLALPVRAEDQSIKTFADWQAKHRDPARLTDADLADLPPGVTELNINNCGKVGDAGIAHLKNQSKLRKLAIGGAQISAAGLKTIGTLTSLEDLTIHSEAIVDADLVHLAPLKKLRSLMIYGNRITQGAAPHLGELSGLEVLKCNLNFNDAALPHISKLIRLKNLSCHGEEVSDLGAVQVGKMAGLEVLWLTNNKMTDATLESISRLPSLKELRIYSCDGVTHQGVSHLGKLPALEQLHLFCKNASGPGIAGLKNAPRLRTLHLDHLRAEHAKDLAAVTQIDYLSLYGAISDAHLTEMKSLTKLNHLYAGGKEITSLAPIAALTELKELHLSEARLTDEGFKPVAKLTKLRKLNVKASAITTLKPIEALKELEEVELPKGLDNSAIDTLIGLPKLKSILVNRNVNWTDEGVSRLVKTFPKATIQGTD